LSVRVRRELREEAERLGVDLRAVVEKALEEEIRRARMQRPWMLADEALDAMNLTVEEWVRAVPGDEKGLGLTSCTARYYWWVLPGLVCRRELQG